MGRGQNLRETMELYYKIIFKRITYIIIYRKLYIYI